MAMALDSKSKPSLESEPEEEPIFIEAQEENLSIDKILEKWVGEFGPGQLIHFVLVSLAWGLEALHTFVVIFSGRRPDWECKRSPANVSPVCGADSNLCELNRNSWDWVRKNSSIVSQWDLICREEYKVGLAGSIFFGGMFFGAGLFGSLADSSLGRKGALRLACILTAIFGIFTSLSPNYWIYMIARAMTGFGCAGIGLCSFVLATEPVGPSKRGPVGMSAFYFFSLGTMFLPAFAYLSSSWRYLYFLTSIPTLCYPILVLPFVSESPRWFLVQGKQGTAVKILRLFANKNNRRVPDGITIACEAEAKSCKLEEEEEEEGKPIHVKAGSILDVFRYKSCCKRMIVMLAIWFIISVIYYGISLNIANIQFNLYIGVVVNAAVEVPAFAITALLLHRYGRRYMLIATFLFSAVFCTVASVLYAQPLSSSSPNSKDLKAVWGFICGALGIFAMAGTYNLVYIYTTELFPTEVRNAAMGMASQVGQFGSMVAPLVVVLAHSHAAYPFAIFAGAAIVGAMLGTLLPETMNEQLWETLQGMEGSPDF